MVKLTYKRWIMYVVPALLAATILLYGFHVYSEHQMLRISEDLEKILGERVSKLVIEIKDVQKINNNNAYSITLNLSDICVADCPEALKFSMVGDCLIHIQVLAPRLNGVHVKKHVFTLSHVPSLFYKMFISDGEDYNEVSLMSLGKKIPDAYRLNGYYDYFQAKVWEIIWNEILSEDDGMSLEIRNVLLTISSEQVKSGDTYVITAGKDGVVDIDYPRHTNIESRS